MRRPVNPVTVSVSVATVVAATNQTGGSMGIVEALTVAATVTGVIATSLSLYKRLADWMFRDSRVTKVAEGLSSMESMTELSGQLRELGQDDWADELESDAYRTGMWPLAVFDDRREHPAPFIAGTTMVVSFATMLLASLGVASWPSVARTVVLVSFVLIVLSSVAFARASFSAADRRRAIVDVRSRNALRNRQE